MPQIPVQPSSVVLTFGQPAIPSPGLVGPLIVFGDIILPVSGVATCQNLVADSPPTLLEEYQFYSYSIRYAVFDYDPGGALPAAPNVTTKLTLLRNEREIVRTDTDTQPWDNFTVTILGFSGPVSAATGIFSADLVNPFVIGARDRLTLAIETDSPVAQFAFVGAGWEVLSPDFGFGPPSSLSYNTIAVPARQRI